MIEAECGKSEAVGQSPDFRIMNVTLLIRGKTTATLQHYSHYCSVILTIIFFVCDCFQSTNKQEVMFHFVPMFAD